MDSEIEALSEQVCRARRVGGKEPFQDRAVQVQHSYVQFVIPYEALCQYCLGLGFDVKLDYILVHTNNVLSVHVSLYFIFIVHAAWFQVVWRRPTED